MNTKKTAAIALALYLTIVVVFMLLARRFDLEIFFVLSLIGILVIAELIGQQYVKPRYMRSLSYLIGAGIVVFGIMVIQKVVEILAR
jgi:hypothetical protein